MEIVAGRTSVDKVTDYVKTLVLAGMSAIDIANRAGVSVTVVQGLLRGDNAKIWRINEEAILGVPVPEEGYLPVVDGLIGSAGTARRLQALAVQGFPLSFLCPGIQMPEPSVSAIRSGYRAKVLISCMVRVRTLHERLWDENPLEHGIGQREVSCTKSCARRNKWWPTEAWSDIDDDACEPNLHTPKYVRITEDYRELTERFGLTRRQAADRLGVSVDALNAALGYYTKRMASAT